MNTWPGGRKRALSQREHESWNASHYPGTRQLCAECSEPTGRCEEDSIFNNEGESICDACYELSADAGEVGE